MRQYAREERMPIRFCLDVVLHEGGSDPSMLLTNRHFRSVLEANGYEIARYSEFNGGHDYLIWRGALADGLMALVGTEPK